MALTIEGLQQQLAQLKMQQQAAVNAANQMAGAMQVVESQIAELQKEKEAELKKAEEAKKDGEVNNECAEQAA